MSTVETLGRIPVVGWLVRIRRRWLVRTSNRWLFDGIFPDYDSALKSQPRASDLPEGYQAEGIAELGIEWYSAMRTYDYPVVYWLRELLVELDREPSAVRIADLGGHLGEKRQVWCTFVPEIADTQWTVCETEDAVREARSRGLETPPVEFAADPSAMDGADILIASGSLQYLPWNIEEMLARLDAPPPVLLFNKVPLSEGDEFWTLQNMGRTSVPYRVFHQATFLAALERLGYSVVDQWTVPELGVAIAFKPGLGTPHDTGLLLRRTAPDSAIDSE